MADVPGLREIKVPNQRPTALQVGNLLFAYGLGTASDYFNNLVIGKGLDDSELGRVLGEITSSGVGAATNTISNNILKGEAITSGLGQNVGASLAGTGAGITANYIGQGINKLGGDTRLSRAAGAGTATLLGSVGGQALSNLVRTGKATNTVSNSIKAIQAYKAAKATHLTGTALAAAKAGKMAGMANLAGLGMTVAGSAIGAATGPSKEYGGKYGKVTQGMDLAYDAIMAGVNFVPGFGLVISGAMALNKGLSNVFGSTSGMTLQDSILGSAFTPAPIKWMNMANAKTTSTFGNQSWQNQEKIGSFMLNSFGDLESKFDKARTEAGKTYGTVSLGAYRKAQDNLDFANYAWNKVLDMADLNELLNIRSQYMTSINNQRYAQMIQGGWSPIERGKMGMKILNNATNHNIGMRLLSAAALIDNKQIILSRCRDLD